MFDFAIPPNLPKPIHQAQIREKRTLVIEFVEENVKIYGVFLQQPEQVVMVFDDSSILLITSRISRELIASLADLLADNFGIENMLCMISRSKLGVWKEFMMMLNSFFDCQLVQALDVDEYEWSTLLCQL